MTQGPAAVHGRRREAPPGHQRRSAVVSSRYLIDFVSTRSGDLESGHEPEFHPHRSEVVPACAGTEVALSRAGERMPPHELEVRTRTAEAHRDGEG
jgi:hypothetical protein